MDQLNYRKELESRIINKALKDESFLQELRNNPRDMIEKELGVSIPDFISVRIVEEQVNEVCLVIPQVMQKEAEISDAELEAVSGGWTGEHSLCDWCKYTEVVCGGP